ncbi:GLPGLI family protein [Aquimarina addita]
MKALIPYFTFMLANVTLAQSGIIHYDKLLNNVAGELWATPQALYFDTEQSLFIELGKGKKLTEAYKEGEMDREGIIRSSKKMPSKGFYDYYYIDKKQNEILFKEQIAETTYEIKNTLEPIIWVLYDEQKDIEGFSCQKATTTFRGRDYTAWFTSDIPVDIGPWKLNGLPGLIMDVIDATGKYRFRISKIDLKPDQKILQENLKKPNQKNTKNFEVYKNAVKNAFDDQMAIAQSRIPKGAKLVFKGPDCTTCPDPDNYLIERYK